MKQMTSAEIRESFLDFYEEMGHKPVPSSSLVPSNDPTLLFTNAGMVQFKDVFLGLDKRDYTRATTSQKVMRVSGKHSDLENVGPSLRHHTFFEMLGNFSFGDYFKKDAIRFAYEILTTVYKLPADRLVYTVYEDDDDAYNHWVKDMGISPKRVARMGPETNFWQMADTGPCGPTSEIHWDKRPEDGEDNIVELLQVEDERFLEIWNLVFMQFNRTEADPEHTGNYDDPLPAPGVDTGMGLERIVSILQEVDNNYDTDLFTPIMKATQELTGDSDEERIANIVPYRVIADHLRAAVFMIADGVLLATPAGSTAYNLSAHGTILPLRSQVLALTPISAFRPRRWRGAVLDHSAKVSFRVLEKDKRPVNAVADFDVATNIERVDIFESKKFRVRVLFDPNMTLDERILKEQFTA